MGRLEGFGVFSNGASCIAIIVIVLFEGGENREDASNCDESLDALWRRHDIVTVLPFEVVEELADLAVEPRIYLEWIAVVRRRGLGLFHPTPRNRGQS